MVARGAGRLCTHVAVAAWAVTWLRETERVRKMVKAWEVRQSVVFERRCRTARQLLPALVSTPGTKDTVKTLSGPGCGIVGLAGMCGVAGTDHGAVRWC